MSELEIMLQRISTNKQKGETRLTVNLVLNPKTIVALTDMGYLVLQVYINGYINTIVGWRKEDD